MSRMLDGNTAALSTHEAEQDVRQKSADHYQDEAEANVHARLVADGMDAAEATAYMLTSDGADLVEAEIDELEQAADDAWVDHQIDSIHDE